MIRGGVNSSGWTYRVVQRFSVLDLDRSSAMAAAGYDVNCEGSLSMECGEQGTRRNGDALGVNRLLRQPLKRPNIFFPQIITVYLERGEP